jgi:ATP-dependent helicase/DNAse subunit B
LRRWTPNDGLVDPSAVERGALQRHQLSARSYSATALQHFAACPYRFFLQAIIRLEPREEIEALEAIDPLTRGALYHEVQFETLTALRAADMLPLHAAALEAGYEMVEAQLVAVAERYNEELAPAIERVWQDGIESIRADLREWMRRMTDDPAPFRPERFELSFGLIDRAQSDPASITEAIPLAAGINLRGSIDLVERGPDGALRVTDHKTGRVRAEKNLIIGGGKTLQPVLYALAAERLLREPVASGRLYYCTAAGSYEERTVPLDDAARDATAVLAQVVGNALDTGFLPAAPGDRECDYCDYRAICGPYEQTRVRIKSETVGASARLADLARLRELR